jgi:hypothetical protein
VDDLLATPVAQAPFRDAGAPALAGLFVEAVLMRFG